ncbi:MAG TPA: hypothetical protein VL137_12565, partial [Polyangiaceae bacterium]|nr:hypothetical protein [Polyangiaceae bacterium]
MISVRGVVGFGLALLVAGWAAGCSSSKSVSHSGDSGSDASAGGSVTGCNEITTADGCVYKNVGCDANTRTLDTPLEDVLTNCKISVHLECKADGCVGSFREIPPLTQPTHNGDASSDSGIPPVTGTTSPFGAACDADADCGNGQICLRADDSGWLGGGPSHGYCTVACSTDSSICRKYPNSVCVSGASAGEAYCFEGCTPGVPDPNNPKCQAREDVTCWQLLNAAVCQPMCGSDSQCPTGRFCDLLNGVCVTQQPAGDPIGTACDPTAATNNCASGVCDNFGSGYGACSGRCNVGLGIPACGIDPNSVHTGDPVCLALFSPTDDVGDVGVCVQRCDCNGDCLSSAAGCFGLPPDLTTPLMAQGLCIPKADLPDGGAGLVCTAGQDGGNLDGGNPGLPD